VPRHGEIDFKKNEWTGLSVPAPFTSGGKNAFTTVKPTRLVFVAEHPFVGQDRGFAFLKDRNLLYIKTI
jgi:hypothetical protein